METLIEKIQQLMLSDTEDQSERLKSLYESCVANEKEAIDQAFICLCGYSLKTILAGDA